MVLPHLSESPLRHCRRGLSVLFLSVIPFVGCARQRPQITPLPSTPSRETSSADPAPPKIEVSPRPSSRTSRFDSTSKSYLLTTTTVTRSGASIRADSSKSTAYITASFYHGRKELRIIGSIDSLAGVKQAYRQERMAFTLTRDGNVITTTVNGVEQKSPLVCSDHPEPVRQLAWILRQLDMDAPQNDSTSVAACYGTIPVLATTISSPIRGSAISNQIDRTVWSDQTLTQGNGSLLQHSVTIHASGTTETHFDFISESGQFLSATQSGLIKISLTASGITQQFDQLISRSFTPVPSR